MLSRHGSSLARPVIIHDIIHGLIYVPSTPCCGFFGGSRRMETAPTSTEVLLRPTQSQSDEPFDLRGYLSPTSVYSTWQSQAVTHPIMNRARRCLTSVIEHKPLSERRIPYTLIFVFSFAMKQCIPQIMILCFSEFLDFLKYFFISISMNPLKNQTFCIPKHLLKDG